MTCVKGMSLLFTCSILIQLTSATSQEDIQGAIGGSINMAGTISFSSFITIQDGDSLTVNYRPFLCEGPLLFECGAKLDGGGSNRLFRVEDGGTLILNGITLQNVCARGLDSGPGLDSLWIHFSSTSLFTTRTALFTAALHGWLFMLLTSHFVPDSLHLASHSLHLALDASHLQDRVPDAGGIQC